MVGLMIAFGLLYAMSLAWNIYTNDKDNRFFSVFLLTISAIIFFALYATYENGNIPTAMDVYQGKTTIEYKVVDDVKVDSVVIFKTMQLN